MRNERGRYRFVWGLPTIVVVLLLLVVVAAAIFGWPSSISQSAAPAWVQAIGSVGAILATGWSVERAHRLQEKQRTRDIFREHTRFLEGAFQLVGGMRGVAEKIEKFEAEGRSTPAMRRSMLAELGAFGDAFRRFDLSRLDTYAHYHAVLTGDSVTRQLIGVVVYMMDAQTSQMLERGHLQETARVSKELLHAQGKVLHDSIVARGGFAKSGTLLP